jgi:predicted alpha/beta-fold hydrolase
VEQAALHIAVERKWRAVILNYARGKDSPIFLFIYIDGSYSYKINGNLLTITLLPYFFQHEIKVQPTKGGKGEALVGGQSLIDAGDLSFLVSYIRKHHDGFLGALGFSMGGAKLVQYLCRTKECSGLDAAGTISSPLDFTERNYTVHRPIELVHRIYHFVIAASVKFSLARNYFQLRNHPRLANTTPFRRSLSSLLWWLQTNTVTEIDRSITMPSKGYSDIQRYYNDATYIHQLRDSITMPFLCLTAKNDPFVPTHIIPTHDVAADNENVFIVNTPKVGGHIGFWLPGRGCWATRACLSFFDSVVSGL